MTELNETHDPSRRSWIESANAREAEFPIQNLPFGMYQREGGPRGCVALGDQVIDLPLLADSGLLAGAVRDAAAAARGPNLNNLLLQPRAALSALRARLSDLFRSDAAAGAADRRVLESVLVPMAQAAMLLPVRPPAFTDFCCSLDHIRRMSAALGQPIKPAWTHLPVAYNGRASSVAVSGTPVKRPKGQFELQPGSAEVRYGPEAFLDFELELGVWLAGGTALGHPITVADAQNLMFGCSLVNDWSARAIQFFESMLGPHLGKSFLTTVSAWIVTMEALAPFRVRARGRDETEPSVPKYLLDTADRQSGALRIELTANLSTPSMRAAGQRAHRIVRTPFECMFWTFAQMIAHQASNGCRLEPGDLVASGTVSGPGEAARACLAEINGRGATPIELPGGEKRTWLEDGDEIEIRGRAHTDGFVSIGFGACTGRIAPAVAEAI